MYKITNKMNDVRRFRDRYLGKDIHVEPGKSVLTKSPPEEGQVWKIESVEDKKGINSLTKPEEKKIKLGDKHGSSSNR